MGVAVCRINSRMFLARSNNSSVVIPWAFLGKLLLYTSVIRNAMSIAFVRSEVSVSNSRNALIAKASSLTACLKPSGQMSSVLKDRFISNRRRANSADLALLSLFSFDNNVLFILFPVVFIIGKLRVIFRKYTGGADKCKKLRK